MACVLTIGAYSLLIADACSGLNSMVALSGIGLLYVYLAGHASRAHNIALLLSILPIAFLANIIRVALLVLITYYGGESSGKAFHDHAGVLEVALAFGGFFAFDHLLMLMLPARCVRPAADRREPLAMIAPQRSMLMVARCVGRGRRVAPHAARGGCATSRCRSRSSCRGDSGSGASSTRPTTAIDPRSQRPGETDPEAPYDDVLMRSYTNAHGEVVMLALAYGRHQRQEIKIHRPELCYTSQGYAVLQEIRLRSSQVPASCRGARARACS